MLYVSYGTADIKSGEGGDDVKSAWPLCPGLHTRYNGQYNRLQGREAEPILKAGLSSDCRLQLACMKPELLVNARQHSALNTLPGIVHTAVTSWKLETPKVGILTLTGGSCQRWGW